MSSLLPASSLLSWFSNALGRGRLRSHTGQTLPQLPGTRRGTRGCAFQATLCALRLSHRKAWSPGPVGGLANRGCLLGTQLFLWPFHHCFDSTKCSGSEPGSSPCQDPSLRQPKISAKIIVSQFFLPACIQQPLPRWRTGSSTYAHKLFVITAFATCDWSC